MSNSNHDVNTHITSVQVSRDNLYCIVHFVTLDREASMFTGKYKYIGTFLQRSGWSFLTPLPAVVQMPSVYCYLDYRGLSQGRLKMGGDEVEGYQLKPLSRRRCHLL